MRRRPGAVTRTLDPAAMLRAAVAMSVWLALHAYAGRPLLVAAAAGGVPAAAGWFLLLLLAAAPLAAWFAASIDPRAYRLLQWSGWIAFSLSSLLFFFAFAGDLLRLSLVVTSFILQQVPLWPESRIAALTGGEEKLTVLRLFGVGTVGTVVLLALVGFVQARNPVQRRVTIPIADLPEELEGFRIVQISDLHVGPTIGRSFVERVVASANAMQADLIALTGDIGDGHPDALRADLAPLGDLESTHGSWYVTGNHEYYWGGVAWKDEMRRLGIIPLEDSHSELLIGKACLVVAGINDPTGRHYEARGAADPERALAGSSADAVRILLAHQPQAIEIASRLGVHLQLSGHTHGGQYFPFNLMIRWFQPIVRDLHRVGASWIYVSRGTGYWGPPTRLGVGGEVTLLELRRAGVAPSHEPTEG